MAKYGTKAKKEVKEAMHEYKTKVSRMMRGVREQYKRREKDGKL